MKVKAVSKNKIYVIMLQYSITQELVHENTHGGVILLVKLQPAKLRSVSSDLEIFRTLPEKRS